MSFRRSKSNKTAARQEWRDWIAANERSLRQIGIPPEVLQTQDHWLDFLNNGWLDDHCDCHAGFAFDMLTHQQMRELLTVLESWPTYATQPMVGWIRHHLGLEQGA